tara:strand:+ start:532 stop:828 length:297 start_codon:yes stop_codon:yes gene_type:complete
MDYGLCILFAILFLIYIYIFCKDYKEVEPETIPEPDIGPGIDLIVDHPDECVICLDPGVNYALRCTHKYHKECLLRWFQKIRDKHEPRACPICQCPVN